VSGAATFGHESALVIWNEIASGVALFALAALALRSRRSSFVWAEALLGLWLIFSPVALWAPAAAAHANAQLVGILIVVLAVAVPASAPVPGSDVPPGWTYNPSSWPQRAPIIALGFLGYLVSRYLTAYQLGHLEIVWDPLFGEGTARVLESEVSRAFPVADAGLGALIYLVDSLSATGNEQRWRATPWAVAILGIAAIPLGLVSMVLVVLQPIAVGAWCTPCLVQATITLAIIALAVDEVFASLQFLWRVRRSGGSAWRAFWMGGDVPDAGTDERGPGRWSLAAMTRGVRSEWSLLAAAAVGVALLFAPDVLGGAGMAAVVSHVSGGIAITAAVVALAEVARPVRLLNVPLGAVLVLAGVLSGGATTGLSAALVGGGVLLALLSLRAGDVRERYGGWDRRLRWLFVRRREA
jgi:hypothetical protein